jgi:uncharacterized protein
MRYPSSMFDSFVPHPRLRNGHAMTLWAWGRPRRFPALPPAEDRLFPVAPDVQVLGHCHWHQDRESRVTLVALHGLEGSSTAHYMRGLADKAWAAGFNVVRLNQRNCGNTEHLSATLYHSGLTADVDVVLRALANDGLPAFALAGYSLGGNLALKLAGEYGDRPPVTLVSVVAVSPVMDLARCIEALERPQNVMYQWNFVRNLKSRMRRKAALAPDRFSTAPLARVRTVRDFDEFYTAPHFGFRDAADYYDRAAALRVVDRIAVPTLIVAAEDDPFVPRESFEDPAVTGNPHIRVLLSRHGGHCAFLSTGAPGRDGYWAETLAVEFSLDAIRKRLELSA